MSYSIKVGQFAKRINSTKRPTASDLAAFVEYDNVFLKSAPTEYNNPVIRIEAEFASFAPNNYNYAIMFGRWYWISNVIAIRTNLIELHLSIDVLARARDAILDTKAFIEYGMNDFNASLPAHRIPDSRRPIGKNPINAVARASFSDGKFTQYGTYILQVVSNGNGVSCYAVSGGVIRRIMEKIEIDIKGEVDNFYEQAVHGGTQEDVLTALVGLQCYNYKQSLLAESGIQAIKSIHWIPLHYTEPTGTNEEIYLGDYATGETGKLLSQNANWINTGSINIPWLASDWQRNNTQISIYIPFFGTIPLPIDQCINNASIDYTISLNLLSGDLTIRITSGNQTVYTGSTNIAAPYAIGFANVGMSAMLSGKIEMLGGGILAATGIIDGGAAIVGMFTGGGGTFSEAVSATLSGAQNIQNGYSQTIQPIITSSGSMGGLAAFGQEQDIIMTVLYFPPIDDPYFEALYGHPVFKVDFPVNGFCKTRGFSLSLGLEPQYISLINRAMDGGVFIE